MAAVIILVSHLAPMMADSLSFTFKYSNIRMSSIRSILIARE